MELLETNTKGSTLIEVMTAVLIICSVFGIGNGLFLNNRGATEKRALEGAQKFITRNNIDVQRVTCAGDSDDDGYGTCTIVQKQSEKAIILQCPTNYIDVTFFGADSCKEVFQNIQVN